MNKRQWFIIIALAIVGYATLPLLFSRYDPSSKWGYELDRPQLIAQAKAISAQYLLETTNWSATAEVNRERNFERYLATRKNFSAFELALLSPLKTRVQLLSPDGQQRFIFDFSAQGQLLRFDSGKSQPKDATEIAPAPSREAAEKIVAELLGTNRNLFSFVADSEPEKGVRKFIWSYVSPHDRALKFNVEALVNGAGLKEFNLERNLPGSFQEELTRRDLASFALVGSLKFILNVLCVLAALVFYFLGIRRKEIDHLAALIFFVAVFVLQIISNYLTGTLDDLAGGIYGDTTNRLILTVVPYILFVLISLGITLLMTGFWASGEAISVKNRTGREAVFAALLRGQFFNRSVAATLPAGLLVGGFIAALPFLISVIGKLQTVPVEATSKDDLFASRLPALAAISEAAALNTMNSYYLLLVFGFIAPLLFASVRTKYLARILLYVVGVILLFDLNPNQTTSLALKAGVMLAIFLTYERLYSHFDLLAVLTASFAAGLVINALALLAQPSPTLHKAGLIGLSFLALSILVTLVLARLSPKTEIAQRTFEHGNDDEAERDRLKAEFNVARKAQEQMLPVAAPNIPGFSIAGLCRPARECGGDLYDFIQMPDGKLGIVVADVSGKGVPAALYMTLTKGLLLSVTETESDPGEILRQVNKQLFLVCKRKMFVTLFFGVLDPVTKILTYCRAGHNPPVWRRMSEQTSQLLNSPGMGLGLNAGKSFDRLLKVAQLQLAKNDLLILYSDGITEAMDDQQEEYGEERLMKVAAIADGMGAEETLSAIMEDVGYFLGDTHPQDDQTVVVVRVLAEARTQ